MIKINICSFFLCTRFSKKYLFFFFGAVAILSYGFLFTPVYALSENITQINFTSSPQAIDSDSLSSIISIQTQNSSNEKEEITESGTKIILTSSSATGQFSNANNTSCTGDFFDAPFLLGMSKGTANKNFCYKDSTAGTHTLDISAEGKTWASATQDITINSIGTPPTDNFTEITEDITIDTTWTKEGSPYIVNKFIRVAKDATLTIEPGVIVKFKVDDHYHHYYDASIHILGKLIANGTVDEPIYFTSNYDDIGGSTDEDYEDCNYEDYDENGDGIGEEVCEMVDWDIPDIGDWDELYFQDSSGSILKNVNIRYSHSAVTIESSSVNFENLNIQNSFYGITGYDNSHVEILGGFISELEGDAVTFFTDSTLTAERINISDVDSGFVFFENSHLNLKDSSVSCKWDGLVFFVDSNMVLSQTDINCGHDGIALFLEAGADINGVKISGALNSGIIIFENTKPDIVNITNSEIFNNKYGITVWGYYLSVHGNSIHDNFQYGVYTFKDRSKPEIIDLDFASNYWGNKTGPKNLSTNPLALGNEVSDHVLYQPFLKYDPLKGGLSNIMFIPGFQASRMYKMVGDSGLGTEFENKLWEPGIVGNVSGMYMDDNGESIDKGVYTRDIVDEAKILGLNTINFYKSFMSKLDSMVSDGEISAWKPIAYDWRQSQLDIVNRGIEKANGEISYTEELTDTQVPYIIGELQKLSDSSNNGKVTIVTHSNGGLVAKALIAKLIEMKNSEKSDLIDHIDNLIEVAPPLVGTPKAVMGILHGYDQGMFNNLLVGRKSARDFGQNVGGAYGLLPSNEYLSKIENNQIILDDSLDKVNNWRSKYGDSIDTYEELESFLVDADKVRTEPTYDDLVNPIIINKKLLNKAKLLHEKIDNLAIPENIKVHQVIGWGLPTPYDIHYKSKKECILFSKFLCSKKKSVLSSDIDFTSGGDGTVVGSSAAYGDGKEYYLNLKIYNDKPGILNRDHSDIFEVPFLFDLIHNILKSDSTLPEYLTTVAPSPVDYTVLKMRSPVSMDIYDEEGLHTGAGEQGIPNSLYMEFGDDKYLVVPKEGNYTLKLAGLSDGIFTLEQEQVVGDGSGDTVVFKDIPTTSVLKGKVEINEGALIESILIDKESDGTFETEVKPTDTNIEEESKDEEVKIVKKSSWGYYPVSVLDLNSKSEVKKDTINNNEENILNNVKKTSKIAKIDQDKGSESISQDGSVLGASVGSVYSSNQDRFKVQLIIVGGFILLLFSLKFIFKVL
jgi:hypothetical protein